MAPAANGSEHAEASTQFKRRRAELLGTRSSRVASVEHLTEAEAAFEERVLKPTVAASGIDPSRSFLVHKADYDASPLLALLRRMPKGAVLHTHGIASGDFGVLVERLRADEHFHVWRGSGDLVYGKVKPFPAGVPPEEGWVPAASVSAEELYRSLTLPSNLDSVEECWKAFGDLWLRVHDVGSCVPFYYGRNGFFWHILEQHFRNGVSYVEIKEPVFCSHIGYDGCEIGDDEWTDRFRETVTEFQQEHPSFFGARLVLVSLKACPVEVAREHFRRAVRMKERMPDFVAGFDLAGPEDTLNPIEAYAEMLEQESSAAAALGIDLPLMLHAGETNIPEASQIVDVVALRCERIGHGFALARHPTLVPEVIAQGALLECCPISNQVLGYVPNLANHAALGLLRAGVPMSLSPDDPGMWHYADVSYDFAAATKAWHLDLAELKALARNSLAYSSLRGARRDAALAAWQQRWQEWIDAEMRSLGQ